jgi:hypothetical protein
MGTPTAGSYVTVSYGHFGNSEILTTFKPNLIYCKCYIEIVFGIWLQPSHNKESTWDTFQERQNGWGSLQWIIENPSSHTIFLDLNICVHKELNDTYNNLSDGLKPLLVPSTIISPPSQLFEGSHQW